jgi:pyochelin biosynthesis protein PchG
MSGGPGADWIPRTIVCGTGFGRTYLSALRRPGMPFALAGILARGSPRSQACAQHYGVALYTGPDQLPPVDIACVAVNAGPNGGQGAALAQDLLGRGIHVLQEHPLLQAELAGCLRQARRSHTVYHLSTNYVHLDSVTCFIDAARRLLGQQPALFIDAVSSFQVLYPLGDILGRAIGGLRPWSLSASPAVPGREALRSADGVLHGIPTTLRIQNQIDPVRRDNGPHVFHRISLATEGGNLLLADTQGPVLWSPRLHMPASYPDAVTIDALAAGPLDLPSSICLTEPRPPSHRQVIGEQWPLAASRALLELRQAILDGEDPLPRGQHHLTLSRLTADITAQLGLPAIVRSGEPDIMKATALVLAEPAAPGRQRPAISQPSPLPR